MNDLKTELPLPTGNQLRWQLVVASFVIGTAATPVALGFLYASIAFTSDQLIYLLWATIVFWAVISPPTNFGLSHATAPIRYYLDHQSEVTEADIHLAFRQVLLYPRIWFIVPIFLWGFGAGAIGLAFYAIFPGSSFSIPVLMSLAGFATGYFSQLLVAFRAKKLFEPIRDSLATQISDPRRRSEIAPLISLRSKFLMSTAGVILVSQVLGFSLAYVRGSRGQEQGVISSQEIILQRLPDNPASLSALQEATRIIWDELHDFKSEFILMDLDEAADQSKAGEWFSLFRLRFFGQQENTQTDSTDLLHWELLGILDSEENEGNSLRFDGPNVYTWKKYPKFNQILILKNERPNIDNSYGGDAVLIVTLLGLGVAMALLAARDIENSIQRLDQQLNRIADGDLREGICMESEDELGLLARSVDLMAISLRSMVSQVTALSNQIDEESLQVSQRSGLVISLAENQDKEVQEATRLMESIESQVRQIANSAKSLDQSLSDSGTSVHELHSSGSNLAQHSADLTEQVESVASAIEEMLFTIRQVGENTESLATATTSASMDIEAMNQATGNVDHNASKMADLTRSMLQSSEKGRQQVHETISGMSEIQESSKEAEATFSELESGSNQVGSIITLIDQLADETNLLSLNAAIIAAQAGEHGRAFSVVAGEIKELAERVGRHTQEISSLVQTIQTQSSRLNIVIHRSAETIQAGVQLSTESGAALEEIHRSAEETNDHINEIVTAVKSEVDLSKRISESMALVLRQLNQIQTAEKEQQAGTESILKSTGKIENVSAEVRRAADEQASNTSLLMKGIEEANQATSQIHRSLEDQSAACSQSANFLRNVQEQTKSTRHEAWEVGQAMQKLSDQAKTLRRAIERFKL